MKRFICFFTALLIILSLIPPLNIQAHSLFTEEQQEYLDENINRTLYIGLAPSAGTAYFDYQDQSAGYLLEVIRIIEDQTSLNIEIISGKPWNQVISALKTREIDLVFGANATDERRQYMSFTRPVRKYPYAVFARKDSEIQSIGDLDGKKIAFIKNDYARDKFVDTYKNINPLAISYETKEEGFMALSQGRVDGFINTGGIIANDFLYTYPGIMQIAEIDKITSDMTISALKENALLIEILDSIIEKNNDTLIQDSIEHADTVYMRKVLRLTQSEIEWLEGDGTATVGVADDYLPFDYYFEETYQGVGGAVLNEIASLVGIKLNVVHGSFDNIYDMALNRQVDIVDMAKTSDRLKDFIFPAPFSEERDQIYGRRAFPHIQDVYGLEGKTVAVIDGFWHEEFLVKNLENVNIVSSKSMEESLELIRKGKADYLIENPTVAEFYINGLGYNDIVKKGSTSSDSFLYFGVNNKKPELASIMDKSMKVISYDSLRDEALMNIPPLTPRKYKRLSYVIAVLITAVFIIGVLMFKILKSLADERVKSQLLSAKNELIYTDALTGLKNRMYFVDKECEFDSMPFPQVIIHADVNDLKKVNDNYGHHMGDKLIIGSSETLKTVFSDSLILRMGGDEFLIVTYKNTPEEIHERIKRVNEIAGFTVLNDSVSSIKGFSIAMGFSVRNSSMESFEDTMIKSDNNMYIHKNILKNL